MKAKELITLEVPAKGGAGKLNCLDINELPAMLANGTHRAAIEALRRELPQVHGAGLSMDYVTKDVPRVYPLAQLRRQGGRLLLERVSGLVVLDVRDVFSADDRARVMAAVRTLPMTLLAFTGSSGMSVKVLVRVRPAGDVWPGDVDATTAFLRAAHRQMRALYGAVVPGRIAPAEELTLTDSFLLSLDAAPLFCPDAQPARVTPDVEPRMLPATATGDATERDLRRPVPADAAHREYYDRLFEALLEGVRREFIEQGREAEMETSAYLRTVVERAAERHVEEAEVRARMMRLFQWEIDEDIRLFVRQTYERLRPLPQTGNKARDTVRGMEEVLLRNYLFRQNTVSQALYFRERTTRGEWRRVRKEDINTMTLEVQEAGIQVNTHHVQTFLGSSRIPRVNPIETLLRRVRGQWDGRDRIETLARRVPTSLRRWPHYFHIWFLAMVRQWMQASPDHGNEVVPLLIGAQGAGKSTFCRRLLPPELVDGYIDHLDFTQEREVLRAMATFQLINIDEFNRYSARDQAGKLKNYLQMTDIRLRTPYRQTFDVVQRMASFIGTSNPAEVLADTTGSRRFICVEVTGRIDQLTPIDYTQLYAQAVDELDARARLGRRATSRDVGRTYFTKAEENAIQRHNARFMLASVAVERFGLMFEPQPDRRARRSPDSEELTREELFLRVEGAGRRPLGEPERRRLYAHLKALAERGELYAHKGNRGVVYHVKVTEKRHE